MPQTKHYLWLLAFILIFSSFTLPNHSFAATSSYKIEVNKATNRLYLYKNNEVIKDFPVGTGKEESLTPEGLFTIGLRKENPDWRDSENNRIIPGGHKDNPLGKYWLGIKVHENDPATTYGIHGTIDESKIPGYVSKGCIRMKNKDIKMLFVHYDIPVGTPVWIHSGISTKRWLDNKPKEEPKVEPEESKVETKEESKVEPQKEEPKEISGKIITTTRVKIRQGLSTSTAILGIVNKDTVFTVTGETSGWYRVKLANGKIGFIAKNFAKRFEETTNLQQKGDSKTDQTAQTLQANIKTSLTKEESLKINVSLSNAKNASGTWKITLNNEVIVNEKNEQTTYTHIYKNPKLDSKQIKIKVEFNGTIDGKKVNGVKEVTYNKVEEKMTITPTFKNNLFQLEASLKGNQKAEGIWIIQLGKTKRVVPQSGEKLNEIFNEITFKKNQLFPMKVDFKGFNDTSFVIASYEKKLKVNISKVNLDQTGSQANVEDDENENEDNNETVNNNEDSNKNKEQSDQQNKSTQDVANGSQETKEKTVAYNGDQIDSSNAGKDVSVKDEDEESSTEDEESSEDEDATNQKGGKLPKTATNYPIGILFGFAMIIVGTWMIRFFRTNRVS